MGKEFEGTTELISSEEYLRGYTHDIVSKMSGYFKDATSILEFGAGIGTLAMEWKAQTGIAPQCLEIDEKQQEIIQNRGFVCYQSLEEIPKIFDGIYTSNVLEHIKEDVETLQKLYEHIHEGGVLVVYVPAFMCLFSEMDTAVGHYRRYGKKELLAKVRQAGFNPPKCYFVDSAGFFLSLSIRLFGYKKSDDFKYQSTLKIYDRWIYPISKYFDRFGLRYVFGKNLLLVANKPRASSQ